MINLKKALQVDFSPSLLHQESDGSLCQLQTEAEATIAAYRQLDRQLTPCELAWYNSLHRLSASIQQTITIRYGCND